MLYFLIGSCVVCAWAVLSLMGAEHTRNLSEIEVRVRRQVKRDAAKAKKLAASGASTSEDSKKPPAKPSGSSAKH